MLKLTILSAAIAVASLAEPANIAGTWIVLLEGHQIGMAIEQDGQRLEGTLQIMGRNTAVDGEMFDRSFTLQAQDGTIGGHGSAQSAPLKITGKLNDDGTLEGEMSTTRGWLRWTAERLKVPDRR